MYSGLSFKNQPYVRELLFKDTSHKKRTAYKAMSSGEITVGARKTAARVRKIKNKNPLQKGTLWTIYYKDSTITHW
jgi:hypothetical protein